MFKFHRSLLQRRHGFSSNGDVMSPVSRPFYGKYRGRVTDNKDPLMLGRLRAKVPAIFGNEESGWAMPSVPYAGNGVGFFFIPPIGANVWIEFEAGDIEHPIWSGCFWGIGETPIKPAASDIKVIKTDAVTITLNDTPGAQGMTIEPPVV